MLTTALGKSPIAGLRRRSQIRRLSRSSDSCAPLARALVRSGGGEFTGDERLWIDRIEARRRHLESSAAVIDVADCGAWSEGRVDPTTGRLQVPTVQRTVGAMCKSSSKSPMWASLLFHLIREWKPETCLELGTCMGISTLYQAAALVLNASGRIFSLEGSASLSGLAQEGFDRLGIPNVRLIVGCFQETLPATLETIGEIDYAFIDGHHEEVPTLRYFEQISVRLARRALVVFDDISWSDGMRRAWKALQDDRRVSVAVDLGQIGCCVIDRDAGVKTSIRISV